MNAPSRGFHVSLTVVALLGGLAIGALWLGSGPSPEFGAWLASAKQELAGSRAWQARDRARAAEVAHLQVAAARLRDTTAAWRQRFDLLVAGLRTRLRTVGDSGSLALLAASDTACAAAIAACTARGDSLAVAVATSASRADSNAAGWRRADSLLAVGVRVQECRLNFGLFRLGCPSRTATFVAGGGLVEVLHLMLGK